MHRRRRMRDAILPSQPFFCRHFLNQGLASPEAFAVAQQLFACEGNKSSLPRMKWLLMGSRMLSQAHLGKLPLLCPAESSLMLTSNIHAGWQKQRWPGDGFGDGQWEMSESKNGASISLSGADSSRTSSLRQRLTRCYAESMHQSKKQ